MRVLAGWVLLLAAGCAAGCSGRVGPDGGVDFDADRDGGPITTLENLQLGYRPAIDLVATGDQFCLATEAALAYAPVAPPPTATLAIVCHVPEGRFRWHFFDAGPGAEIQAEARPDGDLLVLLSPGDLPGPTQLVRLGPGGRADSERDVFTDAVPGTQATVATNQDFVVVTGRGPTTLRAWVLSTSDLSTVHTLESPTGGDARITVAVEGDRAYLGVTDSVGGRFVPEGGSALFSFLLPDGEPRLEATYPGRVIEAVRIQAHLGGAGEPLVVTSGMGGLEVHLGDVSQRTGYAELLDVAISGDRVWVLQSARGGSPERILALRGPELTVAWGMPFPYAPIVGLGEGRFAVARDGVFIAQ